MKSDQQIQLDVQEELEWEPAVCPDRISIDVADAVVTLKGAVCCYSEKWHAEQAAMRTSGVRKVNTKISIILPTACIRSDAEIEQSAQSALQWLTSASNGAIQVSVKSGKITLRGVLASDHLRQIATYRVFNLVGVKCISNHIRVKPEDNVDTALLEQRRTYPDRRSHPSRFELLQG